MRLPTNSKTMINRTNTILLSFIAILTVSCGGGDKAFNRNGSTKSLFTVAPGKQVRFSRGNLQYQASTGTWRFAENQYDIIGEDNKYIDSAYDGWIDLFAFGTSGAVRPPYYAGSDPFNTGNDLYGKSQWDDDDRDYSQDDWGVYNAIQNGGNRKGMWRTLMSDEWIFLFRDRECADDKWAFATIDDCHTGVVVLPDVWEQPTDILFMSGSAYGFETNTYTLEEWAALENAGAIFLPEAGCRYGNIYKSRFVKNEDFNFFCDKNGYWSSDIFNEHDAVYLSFDIMSHESIHGHNFGYVDLMLSESWYAGLSVRLVMDGK